MSASYDAVLIVSFGGPEGPDDVLPCLENVVRGRNVPRARLLQVAEHYQRFGGVSPLNEQNRRLTAALLEQLNEHGPRLPIYWGNRNWHPLLADTLRQMASDGIRRAVAVVTSAFSSYSSCRQYLDDIERACAEVGASAPVVDKLRAYFNHPLFVEASAERVRAAFDEIPTDRRPAAALLYTAHSIPLAMAENCRYVEQLEESCRLVSEAVGRNEWRLVFQSRSGPESQPWLEPDICDHIEQLGDTACRDVVVMPIGFISDHIEVIYDLDTQARDRCDRLGIGMVRASTVGTHPRFVTMIRELIAERVTGATVRPAMGKLGASPDVCPSDCCRYEPRRPPA